MASAKLEARGFFRGVYISAAVALAVLTVAGWFIAGPRGAAGVAAGGVISLGVLLSWHWLAAWILATPGSSVKRRLLLAWPLKYGVIGYALWFLLRRDLVNVPALIIGLGLVQAVIFGRALTSARSLLTATPATPEADNRQD